jgi:hypothetical protein
MFQNCSSLFGNKKPVTNKDIRLMMKIRQRSIIIIRVTLTAQHEGPGICHNVHATLPSPAFPYIPF